MDYSKLYPILAFSAHGALGKWWIHKQYGMTKVVCKYAYPYNPKTELQQANRLLMYNAVKNWQGFADPIKNYYNTNFRNIHMSGYNRYISMYLLAEPSDWYNPAWLYRTKITIDNTKVDADLDNFPVYVDLSDLPSQFHDNVKADGADIRVTKSDGITEVPREVVFYDQATDTGELHFKGDLINDTDTSFYIYYGNSSATEPDIDSDYGAENVWTEYEAVWHLQDSMLDSTSNSNDLTDGGTSDTDSGKMGKARSFSSDYLKTTNNLDLSDTQKVSVSYWLNKTATTGVQVIYEFSPNYNSYTDTFISYTDGTQNDICNKGNSGYNMARTSIPTANVFHYAVDTYDFSAVKALEVLSYLDGSIVSYTKPYTGENTGYFGDRQFFIGMRNGTSYPTNGVYDEFRIAKSVISADWVSTEHNNQSSPSTFYDVI